MSNIMDHKNQTRSIDTNHGLSKLKPYLFDLVVATANLIESYDISNQSLLDIALNDKSSSQEILDASISELEDLSRKNIVDTVFEFNPGEGPRIISCEQFE